MSREIKGPEDCIPISGYLSVNAGTYSFGLENSFYPAQEVGQIITLAMDAEADKEFAALYGGARFKECMKMAEAWRSLSDKLKGGV